MSAPNYLSKARRLLEGDTTVENPFNPVGTHTTNGSLASVVTLTKPTGANSLMIQAFAQTVRYTLDGTNPTGTASGTGFQLPVAEGVRIIPVGIGTVIKVIEETAGASIQYQFGSPFAAG